MKNLSFFFLLLFCASGLFAQIGIGTTGQDNDYSNGNTTNRWSEVWAANGTIQTSDIRLKKNIQPLTYGLKEVLRLQLVSYDWKDNSGKNKIGLIAQDVKKIITQVVIGDEEKENPGMN